jgi:hypothetical protein
MVPDPLAGREPSGGPAVARFRIVPRFDRTTFEIEGVRNRS